MIPVGDLNPNKTFEILPRGRRRRPCRRNINAGHPGVEKPHAHLVLWHVPGADEARVAQ